MDGVTSASVFSDKFKKTIENASSVQLESPPKDDSSQTNSTERTSASGADNSLSCSYCRIQFPDLQSQREHFKLDWHRYNLKQSLMAKQPITENEFNVKNDNDDVSSISGSDSEKEDTLDTYATAQGKIFLQNSEKMVFSIYRCLLCDRKEELLDSSLADLLKQTCVNNQQWTVLMLGGGHFAGGVFRGAEPILHKTFHCYTVRAGQGGTQSSRDNKSGAGSHPKSAGASLRRYNEQALTQHIRSIIDTWRTEIDKSSLIIYRASGPTNRSVFFGGSSPPLDRSDKKLRTIPFSTRRATFTELKRVHSLLSTAIIYPSLEDATANFSKQKSPEAEAKRNKARSSCINRAKSREIVERPLPTETISSDSSSEETEKNGTLNLETNDLELSFNDLKEFSDSLTPEERKCVKTKKKKPKKSKSKKLKEREEARRKELVELITKGNVNEFKEYYSNISDENMVENFFNQIIDDNLNTLLHCAAANEQVNMLLYLLQNDADPCVKNKNLFTAYTCTQSKEIREALKQFARENPEKYNYNKAQIPITAFTPEEMADKKRAQRKIKREKEKVKRKENEIKRREQEEQDRFLQLSDREKRALAAERRILDQSGKVIVRCFQCAIDITGKVPFEYSNNVFCTVQCLKTHRLQHPSLLS